MPSTSILKVFDKTSHILCKLFHMFLTYKVFTVKSVSLKPVSYAFLNHSYVKEAEPYRKKKRAVQLIMASKCEFPSAPVTESTRNIKLFLESPMPRIT